MPDRTKSDSPIMAVISRGASALSELKIGLPDLPAQAGIRLFSLWILGCAAMTNPKTKG